MKVFKLTLKVQIYRHCQTHGVIKIDVLSLHLGHMFICEICLTNENLDIIKESFHSSSLSVKISQMAEGGLAEHNHKFVHIFLENFEFPILSGFYIDFRNLFFQEIFDFDLELFRTVE